MEYGISASFAHIFPESYLIILFLIFTYILPLYKGPTPVETAHKYESSVTLYFNRQIY